jgi:hypothetical protein
VDKNVVTRDESDKIRRDVSEFITLSLVINLFAIIFSTNAGEESIFSIILGLDLAEKLFTNSADQSYNLKVADFLTLYTFVSGMPRVY